MRHTPSWWRSAGQQARCRDWAAVAWAAALLTLASCHSVVPGSIDRRDRVFALLLNGGGRPQINFQSHLTHVKGFIELLEADGIDRERIFVFSGDGSDPEADLATREINEIDDFWVLPNPYQQALRPPIEYVDSQIEGYTLRPARQQDLRLWFDEIGSRLGRGDTLLFYVTDHGEENKEDRSDNTIVLWKESLSVTELGELFASLDPSVQVLMLMSQCFSGSFANLSLSNPGVCGYFASTADRPAYGCYPENRGLDGVGHSHELLAATNELGSLPEAQRRVLVSDDTPDVPHASSDFFLRRALERAAGDEPFAAFVDRLLQQAWQDRGAWEEDIRLLDRIGQTYGIFSPRSLAELQEQLSALPSVSEQLGTYSQRWRAALDSLLSENLKSFLEANPQWKDRLAAKALTALDAAARDALARELVAELAPYARADSKRMQRLATLRTRQSDAAATRYRMEVRLGVLMRMRDVLISIAGRAYLADGGQPSDRDHYRMLRACENVDFNGDAPHSHAAELAVPPAFPRLAQDRAVVDAVQPAWMGIRYRSNNDASQKKTAQSRGAVTVMTVYPDSAADKAGMRVGDLILGPPDSHFDEPNQVREWTMQREIGELAPIEVSRGGERLVLHLRPDPFPLKMPRLPGPPKVGAPAPKVVASAYRGGAPSVAAGKPHLLFFWATWCAPCKLALPEILAFSDERGIDVLAITDESRETLDTFFAQFAEPFPEHVATDAYRQSFQSYGVSGTPTFVLIDENGSVAAYETGFDARVGLPFKNWKLEKKG